MVFTRRHSLPFNEWPLSDQAMWQALIAEGDILDGCGPGAGWAPATKDNTPQRPMATGFTGCRSPKDPTRR